MNKLVIIVSILMLLAGCGATPTKIQPSVIPLESTGQEEQTDRIAATEEKNSSFESGSKQGTDESSEQTENRAEVPLVSITDGDTLKVMIDNEEVSVRYLLIDTAETNHPTIGEQPFGQDAKDFVKKLLSGKTVVLVKDTSETDKYNRLLRYVYTSDGRSVQEELLKNGLARVAYVYPPDTKYVDRYREIEKEAAEKKIGIWSVEGYAHIGHEHGYHTEVFDKEKETEPEVSTEKPDPAISTNSVRFVASKNSEVFHEEGCPGGAEKISPKNLIYFDSEEEAIASGRRMCNSNLCTIN